MRMKQKLLLYVLPLTLFLHFGLVNAELIVLQARGGGLKVGQSISATEKIVLKEGEIIYNNDKEIGKVLIDNDYPFALIKYLDKNFDEKINFKTKFASINIRKPNWIK